jgi:hypothetical protein
LPDKWFCRSQYLYIVIASSLCPLAQTLRACRRQ